MLGFAVVDRQTKARTTAIWLTSREGSRVIHTNAVVLAHDDERYDDKVWALTADRAVVLTSGSTPPREFEHALGVDVFDGFIEEIAARQQLIEDTVAAYAAKTKNKNLVIPEFPRTRPKLAKLSARDQPEHRALAVANYISAVWSAWLATDEQRVRRAINPRTGTTPWIMPEELGSAELAEFPPDFGQLVKPEALRRCSTT